MNTANHANEEMVTLPIPKRLYPAMVQALAAALEAETAPTGQTTEPDQPSVPATSTDLIDWTQVSNMKRLRNGLNSDIAIKLLDMTAARPDVKITFDEIYKAAGYTKTRSAGSSLGSMTKVLKRDFGQNYGKSDWPVEHHWAANDDAQYHYLMPQAVADAWNQSAP